VFGRILGSAYADHPFVRATKSSTLPTCEELVTSPRASRNTMAASQDTTDILRNATFSHPDGPAPSVTAADLLLGGAYDPAKLHPMSGLSDNLDYLLLEDDKVNELPGSGTAIPSRGWSDDLCYGTGTMYLTGQFPFPSFISRFLLPFTPFWSFVKPGADSFRLFLHIIHSHLIINLIVLVFVTCSLVFPRARRRWCLGFA
jgi:hypothetical protein